MSKFTNKTLGGSNLTDFADRINNANTPVREHTYELNKDSKYIQWEFAD